MCYGPAFGKDDSHTYIYQTVRIEEGVENMIRFRIKASDGFMRPTKNKLEERGAMFVSGPHLGAMVKDFGSNAPKDTLKVLCLGNSFTYFYGCPTMLKEIAWNEGHFIDVNASLKGGWNMGQHLSLQTTNDLILEGGYDYMILQDQSLVPAKVGHDPIFTYAANESQDDNKTGMGQGFENENVTSDELQLIIDDYNKMFGTSFSTDNFSAYYDDVNERMKKRRKGMEPLDLLLVVGMFLTGFDAKRLNTLYVDKNLEYHGLLQAFSVQIVF